MQKAKGEKQKGKSTQWKRPFSILHLPFFIFKAFMNLKIGVKIGLTFALVLGLGVVVGTAALVDIREVRSHSNKLAKEYAPEVAESGEVERHSLLTMYNMRGYALSGDETYLIQGREYLDKVKKDLDDSQALAEQYQDLNQLRNHIGEARDIVNAYQSMVDETVEINHAIEEDRITLDAAAENYMKNSNAFIQQQAENLSREIRRGHFSDDLHANLIQRLEQLVLLQNIINAGNAIRVANFKAQAKKIRADLVDRLDDFNTIYKMLENLEAITTDEADMKRIDAVSQAARRYQQAMTSLSNNWETLDSLNKKRDKKAKELLDIAQTIFITGMERMVKVAKNTDALLSGTVRMTLAGFVMGLAAAAAVIFLLTHLITSPIKEITAFTKQLGNGDLTASTDIDTKDEIGQMAMDLNRSVGGLRDLMRELADAAGTLSSSSEELSSVAGQMATSAEETTNQSDAVAAASEQISAGVGTVAYAAEQSSALVSSIAAMTEEMSSTFSNVAEAGRKTTENVAAMARSSEDISIQINSVASAAEEMTASLNEVAKNTVQASRISQNAKSRAKDINSRIDALVSASKQIGKVVGVIKDIADQTNMLALNATIEAAGAGDAGKGFAVVAGEVKELARQSADATDEIADQIDQIQRSTGDAVEAINEINKIIGEIASINEMIASSSEEQTATASEISKSVAGVAATVKEVAGNAGESAKLVEEISQSIDDASTTASEVARNIDELLHGVKEVARSSDEAAQGANDVSKNIHSINQAARQTAVGATQTDRSSKDLAELAATLSQLVGRFKL